MRHETSFPGATIDAAVHVEGLHHSFRRRGGDIRVLCGVTLTVPVGGYVSLTGPSGSGKTTLLSLIGGLERPQTGVVWVAGRDLGRLSGDELAAVRRDDVGFVFQHYGLIDALTAEENVDLALAWGGMPRATRRRRVRELLDRVGLSARMSHRPPELSGGERQRVAIARALVNRPRVVLADEPTGNLDGPTAASVMSLLESLRTTETAALVLVSHDPALAGRADRRFTVAGGRLLAADGAERGCP